MVVALLAGLGVAWLLSRLSRTRPVARDGGRARGVGPRLRSPPPPQYQRIETYARPVDAVLRADADDVAVLEWPLNQPGRRRRRQAPTRSGTASGSSTASPASSPISSASCPGSWPPPRRRSRPRRPATALSRIYPLRYLRGPRRRGRGPARPPGGRRSPTCRAGSSGSAAPTGTTTSTRSCRCRSGASCSSASASYDLLVSRPRLRAALRPLRTQAGVEQWVSLTLNGAPVTRTPSTTPTTLSATLSGPAPAGRAQRDRVRARLPAERARRSAPRTGWARRA